MKNLIEIAGIVTKKKVRKIEIFDDNALRNKNSKFNEFYEGLLSNKFANDRDASLFLYDCQPTDDKYRQLKSRFRKRLLNTLFFLDVNTPSTSNYNRAYFSCNKEWSLVKILELNGAVNAAADQAAQMLTTALKYKFSDIIIECSTMLRRFAAENNLEKDFEYYDKLVTEFSTIRTVEVRCESYLQRVMMHYYGHKSDETGVEEKVAEFCDELVRLSEEYDSPVIVYIMYMVWMYRFEMVKDWDSMLEVCERAQSYIDEHPLYYQEDKVSVFLLRKMTAYLHLRDYKNGKLNAEKALQLFEEGSVLWFTFMEYYLLLAMHTDNYLNAMAIYNRAVNHPKFKKLKSDTRDKWTVFEAYINFFVESPATQSLASQASRRKGFKVAKFLSEQFQFSKESKILTAHVLIAQIFFHLRRKSYPAASEATERLMLFTSRQLKPEEYYRTVQFVRMLQQMEKLDYKVSDLSKTDKYHQRIRQKPWSYRGLVREIEIVPYEKLWEIFLAQM